MVKVKIGAGAALVFWGLLFLGTARVLAQAASGTQVVRPESREKACETCEMMANKGQGTEESKDRLAGMYREHSQIDQKHQEMQEEIQRQLIALRKHALELQQMTSTVLATILDQRLEMQAEMKAHQSRMRAEEMDGIEGQKEELPVEPKKKVHGSELEL